MTIEACNVHEFDCSIGFRGRTRPNLLRQETTSMSCALRILYHMLCDENRVDDRQVIEERLLDLVNGGLDYFIALSSELHRESWTPVLLLIFSRILQLPTDKVQYSHQASMYTTITMS